MVSLFSVTPYVWHIKLKYNISLERAIELINGKRCLMCGSEITQASRGRPKKYCCARCRSRYKAFERTRREIMAIKAESESAQEFGTIFIRPKLHYESWTHYHDYLQTLSKIID